MSTFLLQILHYIYVLLLYTQNIRSTEWVILFVIRCIPTMLMSYLLVMTVSILQYILQHKHVLVHQTFTAFVGHLFERFMRLSLTHSVCSERY